MSIDYDEQNGAQAFERLKPEMEALQPHEIKKVTVNLQEAALKVIRAAVFLSAFRDRFAELPARAFDMKHFDGLKSTAKAAWYVKTERIKAENSSTEARLPESLLEEAMNHRRVMLRVVDYHLDDAASTAEIENIRSGAGYVDLANDLNRIADLYQKNQETLASDHRLYRAEDTNRARKLAELIIDELAIDRSEKAWKKHQNKIWTILQRSYKETKLAAEWLLRDDDIPADLFPSLHGGKHRRRTLVSNEETSTPQNEPS